MDNPMLRTLSFALFVLMAPIFLQAQEEGMATFYSDTYHGSATASGERYDKGALSAAHRTLPFGTRVKVTHLASGKSVVVRINDRGVFGQGVVIDLSRKAAETLGMIAEGRAKVRLEVLADDNQQPVQVDDKGNRTDKPKNKPAKEVEKDKDKPVADANLMSPGGLFKIAILPIEKKDWAVQVGNFSNYESMMGFVSGLHGKWFKNVLVLVSGTEKEPQYKVVLGPFPDEPTAKSYEQNIKKKHNLDGFVVNLATAK